jgi:Arc/MetJ-type ribon-helix-helix transcriptional regulator
MFVPLPRAWKPAGLWEPEKDGVAVSKSYVETSDYLLEELDEMVREGYYHDRTEAVNDALEMLIRQYKVAKLRAKDQREGLDHPGSEQKT